MAHVITAAVNMKKIKYTFVLLVLGLPLLAAAWANPTSTPTSGNGTSPLTTSGNAQSRLGGLILDSNGSAAYGLIVSAGLVGIGTQTPASMLSVAGGMQIGDDAATCTAAKAGTMRWHTARLQYCNGSSWTTP